MGLNFFHFIILELLVGIPNIYYYYIWGVKETDKSISNKEILKHVKYAYIFTAFTIVYLPSLLYYFLFSNFGFYTELMQTTGLVLLTVIVIFEAVNYYSYIMYEKKRF